MKTRQLFEKKAPPSLWGRGLGWGSVQRRFALRARSGGGEVRVCWRAGGVLTPHPPAPSPTRREGVKTRQLFEKKAPPSLWGRGLGWGSVQRGFALRARSRECEVGVCGGKGGVLTPHPPAPSPTRREGVKTRQLFEKKAPPSLWGRGLGWGSVQRGAALRARSGGGEVRVCGG